MPSAAAVSLAMRSSSWVLSAGRSWSFARRITRRKLRSRTGRRVVSVAIVAGRGARAALGVDDHAFADRIVAVAGIAPLDASAGLEAHADDRGDIFTELRAGEVVRGRIGIVGRGFRGEIRGEGNRRSRLVVVAAV